MGSCDDQHQFFSSVMNNMIDQYLPLRRIQVDSNDKPWITPEVKDLISKRQAALAMAWRLDSTGTKLMLQLL